ncbi:MAG: peptidoglycan DD-metalloendopeptidase family protein [Bacteroidales bacterium]|nr:peptidoglycan DD-metalloendopeptidase family protein [Bacteroidales bacterium]
MTNICHTKRYIASFLLLAVLIFLAQPIHGQSKSQLEKEKAKTEAEIKRLNNELAKAKKNTKLTTSQLNALNKKIQERTRLINNINTQMGILNNQIAQTQDSILTMQHQVDSMKQQYAKIVRALYRERPNLDRLALLFDTPSYNRSFLRLKYFAAYSRYRRHQANLIRGKQDELSLASNKLERQRDEQNSLLSQEKRNKAELSKEQALKQRNLNNSKANEKTLNQQIAQKEKQRKALDAKIKKIIDEEVAKANKSKSSSTGKTSGTSSSSSSPSTPANTDVALSNDFASNRGRLSWPVYYKRVIREFGRYTHESGGENMNNGIDLETAVGTTVYSIFSGTVTRVFTAPNGTSKCIIVRHGDYMSVYIGLASVSVKEGAKVSTKQTLGTVADAGGHGEFSFQIWKERTPQNPRNWLR